MRTPGAKVAAALAVVYVVWGSTYLGIKVAVETIPPMLMAGMRFGAAGLALWMVLAVRDRRAARRGTPAPAVSVRQWAACALTGTMLLVGGNGAVTWAEQSIDSGVAALLVATVPMWMALFARVWLGQRLSARAVTGLVVGFVGVGVLVQPDGAGGAEGALLPMLVVLGGAACWGAGSIVGRRLPLPQDGLRATAMQMLAGAGVFGLIGLGAGEQARLDLAQVSTASVVALAYLTVFGSLLAFSAYTWLLRTASPSTVSTYAYVNPVVAVLLGAVVLAEPLTPAMLGSSALIVAGVALIVRRRPATAEPGTDTPQPDAPSRDAAGGGGGGGAAPRTRQPLAPVEGADAACA